MDRQQDAAGTMHHFPLHIGDYEADTAWCSMLEDCAYSRLMRHYYKTERPLPADLKRLYTICGATSAAEKKAVDTVVREFFRLDSDAYHNKRCDLVIAQYKESAELARQNGKRGGRPPKQKPETNRPGFVSETDPVSSGLAKQNPTATQSERVSKANQKPITNNQNQENTNPPYPPSGEAASPRSDAGDGEAVDVPDSLGTSAFLDAWSNWLKYRRSKRKKVTAAAATVQLRRLAEVGPDIAIQAIEEAIANDYQGLFPDKVKSNGQRTTTVAAGPGQRFEHAPGEPDPGAF